MRLHGYVACLVLSPCLVCGLFTGLSVFTIKKARDPDACALGFGFAPEDEPGRVDPFSLSAFSQAALCGNGASKSMPLPLCLPSHAFAVHLDSMHLGERQLGQ